MHDIIVPRRPTKSKPPRRHLPLVALSLAVVAAGLAVAAFFFGNYFFLLAGIVAYGAVFIGLLELGLLPERGRLIDNPAFDEFDPNNPYSWADSPGNPTNPRSPFFWGRP